MFCFLLPRLGLVGSSNGFAETRLEFVGDLLLVYLPEPPAAPAAGDVLLPERKTETHGLTTFRKRTFCHSTTSFTSIIIIRQTSTTERSTSHFVLLQRNGFGNELLMGKTYVLKQPVTGLLLPVCNRRVLVLLRSGNFLEEA